ncbi:isochorismatase family protein [Mycoplasmatota bacterium]|nr:isochorismatase family protein [Mycoplasmatota bacterium]
MSIAFLIVDMQKAYEKNRAFQSSIGDALESINHTSKIFRKNNLPVVIVQHEETGPEYEVMDSLVVSPTDILVNKKYSNAFWKTDLKEILVGMGVEYLVISGLAAEYCVLATYNGALERGFKTSMLQNGLAGYSEDQITAMHRFRSIISISALEYICDSLLK